MIASLGQWVIKNLMMRSEAEDVKVSAVLQHKKVVFLGRLFFLSLRLRAERNIETVISRTRLTIADLQVR